MKMSNKTKLIKLFQNGSELTIRDIKEKLDIGYENARHYLDMVSFEIPVYKSGERKIHGRPSPVFKLLDIEKL